MEEILRAYIPYERLFGGDCWFVGFYTRPQPVFERCKKVAFSNGEVHYSWWRILLHVERKTEWQ